MKSSYVLLRLLSFLRPYKRRLLLAWACVFGSGVFVLVTPLMVAWAIDTGLDVQIAVGGGEETRVALGSTSTLVIAALAIVGAAVLRGVFAYGQTYMGEWLSQRVAYDLRNAIYDRLQRLSYAYHDKAQTGQLMSRATQDVEGVRFYIHMGFLRLVYVIVLLFVVLALMLMDNWRLALVSWVFLPLIGWRSVAVALRLRPVWMRVQDGMARLGTVLQENLSGVRVVKAFAREEHESEKFGRGGPCSTTPTRRTASSPSPCLS